MTIYEDIVDLWSYWCYFEKVLRNKTTNSTTLLSTGKYATSIYGLLRVGEIITEVNATEEIVEKYVVALKPNLGRLCSQNIPNNVELRLDFNATVLNQTQGQIDMTIKPFANSNGLSWDTNTLITYSDIIDHFIPFDLTSATYDSAIYEKIFTVDASGNYVSFSTIEDIFWKFMQSQTIGFTFTAVGGYCDLYGPSYELYFFRPKFTVDQTVAARARSTVQLDTEITAESKVKGVCKDRDGVLITGVQVRIIVFDSYGKKILGTGLSNTSGEFLISADCKMGETVIVTFVDDGNDVSGSEIMTAISKDAT